MLPNLEEIGPRTKNVTSKKAHWEVKNTPPGLMGLNISECKSLYSKLQLKFECISNASIVIAYHISLQK